MVGKIAFLFPGQGSQSVGMAKMAYSSTPQARSIIEKADHVLGYSLSHIMFNGPEDKLRETSITQPALFVASAAGLEILKHKGIAPSWAAGHSLGEYSALYAAGVLSFEDALKLVQVRGQAMQEAGLANPGGMAAILGLPIEKVESVCREVSQNGSVCGPANFNSETQIVISGHKEAIHRASERATQEGALKVVILNVSGAFHSPLMSPVVEKLKPWLEKTTFADSQIPVITNVDAHATVKGLEFREKLIQQIEHSVLWHSSVKTLLNAGADTFIEVGSGKVLISMVKKLDRQKAIFCTDEPDMLDKLISAVGPK